MNVHILFWYEQGGYKNQKYKFCYYMKKVCIKMDHIKNDHINFATVGKVTI